MIRNKQYIRSKEWVTHHYLQTEFNLQENSLKLPEISANDIIKYKDDTVLSLLYIYNEDNINNFLKDLEEKGVNKISFPHYLKPLYDYYKEGKFYIKETKIIINGYNEIFRDINKKQDIILYIGYDNKEYKYNIIKNIFYSEYPDGDEYIELENLLLPWSFFNYELMFFI